MSQQSFILTDGSNDVAVLNSSPVGTEYGIGVRIIGTAGTSSSFTQAFPSSGTAVGFSDGTNMQGARVFDLDSGAGTQYVLGVGLRLSSNGGSVEAGTGTNPIRIDPTGTTTQPISGTVTANAGSGTFTVAGTVTANQGGTWTVQPGNTANTTPWLVTVSTALPAGSNTIGAVTQASGPWTQNITQFGGTNISTGTGASGAGIPRVTVANDSNILATQSGTWTVQPGNTQNTTAWLTQDAADGPVSPGAVASKSILAGGQFNTSLPVLANTQQAALQVDSSGRLLVGSIASALPTGANVIGAVTQSAGPWTQNITQFGSSNVVTGTGASGSGIPRVTVANDSNILATQSGTWTVQQGSAPWSIVGIRTNNTAVPSSNHLGVLSAVASSASQSYTDGYQVLLSTDLSGHLRVTQGNAASLSNGWPVKLTDGSGNQIGTLSKTLYSDPNGDRRTIHNNATITSSGSTVLTWNGHSEWYLIINIKNAPTGTSPTIQFAIDQVDPIDQTTILSSIVGVKSDLSPVLNSAGVTILEMSELVSDAVKVSWTVTGAGASFTGVNVTWCGHGAGNSIEGQSEDGDALHDGPVPIAGVDGSNLIHTLKVDSSGNLQVTASTVPQTSSAGFKAGFITLGGGSSGTLNAIRATTYNEQSSNAQRSVSSTSTNDTSAGTGARTIELRYYDSTGNGPYSEIITMNGTTAVNTVATDICYIESIKVKTSGSLGTNSGVISLFVSTGGTGGTVGSIGTGNIVSGQGDGRTLWAHHYTPSGKTVSITGLIVAASAASTFHVKSKTLGGNAETIVSELITTTAAFQRSYQSPLNITGPARITIYGVPSTNGVSMNASMDYFEV